jgi:hypothetical protein
MDYILDDTEISISPFSPTCLNCKHLIDDLPMVRKCAAFEQIPLHIWEGEPHNAPLPTQTNSIVFEPIEPNR